MSHSLQPGDRIVVTIEGRQRQMRVVVPDVSTDGHPVVWACSEVEWESAQEEGRRPEGLAWPLAYVQPLA